MTDEPDAETWSPVQTVESVLISIVSLLEDPNISSPANVDAAVDFRKNPEQYKQRVKMEVERSKQDIPPGFEMPTSDTAYLSQHKNENPHDQHQNQRDISENFWYDSDLEDDEDVGSLMNDGDSLGYNDDDVYNYQSYRNRGGDEDEDEIEFEDDDEDDSIDNDSVMDRKQPHKAGDESEDVEEVEKIVKK